MESCWLEHLLNQPFCLLFLLCISLIVLQAVKLYQRRRKLLRDLNLFPAPPGHWFYGHKKFYPEKEFELYNETVEKYPCAVPIWIGPFMMFFYVYDPDYIKALLNRKDSKDTINLKILTSWLGRGLVSLEGSTWSYHRQMVKPGFHGSILKIYVTIMSESVRVMLNKWEKLITQDPHLELWEDISLMALDCIMKCAFSQQGSVQTDSTFKSYLEAVTNLGNLTYYRLYNVLHYNDLIYKFSSQAHLFYKYREVTHQHIEKVIQDRKDLYNNELKQGTTQKKRHQDFLDILLSARAENGKDFSEADLLAEVNMFLVAGYETTASAISWIFYCMAKYPEHQQRCREELRGILGDGDAITWEHLSQMSYTTMCIKECLRLYSPAVFISRLLSEPITFPDGRSLPAGVTVLLNIWALHHNPAIWEDPQVFNPLRFSKENRYKRHTYAFIPFSAGSRNCIGQQFAMMECKIALALMLLHFELVIDPSKLPQPMRRVVLKSQNGMHLILKKLH
ncbi:cytochrome P450 4Z1 [Orycteropus afer afer]|uniref:Cytochrome P450 4Z1 n=1 Tax=Orycteropus afer afer TaxID=1230840 RepID=A0A8B7AAB2_ORYAF|nr:cytochrome P450 4Z1 [Orycteropus afer afer]